jgi:uncharacterized delta-60 repeat protein
MRDLSPMLMSRFAVRLRRVAVLALLLGSTMPAFATAPWLDPFFGVDGMVQQPFLGMGGIVYSVSGLRDGRILASGSYVYGRAGRGAIPVSTGVLARFNADGSHDTGFGNQGIVDPSSAYFRLLQRDGRMVGVSQTGLTRYLPDASPEPGFKLDGAIGIPWFAGMSTGALAQQADGRIVLAGIASYTIVLLRFDVDGSLDPTFNYVGALIVPHGDADIDIQAAGLVIQPDGKLVVAASSVVGPTRKFTLVRYNANGSPDTTFGNNGRTSATFGSTDQDDAAALLRQPNGRLVVIGSHGVQLQLVGFRADDGSVDGGFGTAGVVRVATGDAMPSIEVRDATTQPDGKLLVVFSSDFNIATHRLMRFTVDGAPDTTFGVAGTFISSSLPGIAAIALMPDGDLVLGGTSSANNFAIAHYLSGTSAAIEFYNAALDHYFMSMNPQEVADLDLGVHAGWMRTGQSFPVYGSLATATAAAAGVANYPVCRFYIPPQHGDSHFFSVDPVECAAAIAKSRTDPNFSGYVEETASAFFLGVPNTLTGACPAGTMPVYRLWNQRFDSNHRYTADPAIKAQMIARGYVAEGSGPDSVAMCAPQ